MNIIFLDVDGVLNSIYTWNEFISNENVSLVEEEKVKILSKIAGNNSLIVLSSSWRSHFTTRGNDIVPTSDRGRLLNNLLNRYGMFIYDMTPRLYHGIREREIELYLEENNVKRFLILDDNVGEKFYPNNTIHTLWVDTDRNNCGLKEEHIIIANEILSKKAKIKRKLFNSDRISNPYSYGRH